ncbi:MAG: YihA family ribosome biogenesis GTP-binding protein, partial [Candidatus Dadabacteria bacterium]
MRVTHADFRAAADCVRAIPPARGPEVAVAGRSNVGKSSLINRLTGRRKLARTSGTPGCTRGLVFFEIDRRLTLVDLPGYGWARRSQRERQSWKRLVEHYLTHRPELAGVLILVDVRRGPEEEERELAAFLDAHRIARVWVLTKADKLPRGRLARRVAELSDALGAPPIVTSARTGAGVKELWRWIDQVLG